VNKFILIFILFLVAGVTLLGLVATTPMPTTSWLILEQQFPQALKLADYVALSSDLESDDQVPLPLALHLRQKLRPEPRPKLITGGFPESVQHYVLESVPSHRHFHCLVRYAGGKVACIVVRYPAGAKSEALRLRDALREVFPGDRVNVEQTKDA